MSVCFAMAHSTRAAQAFDKGQPAWLHLMHNQANMAVCQSTRTPPRRGTEEGASLLRQEQPTQPINPPRTPAAAICTPLAGWAAAAAAG